VCASNASAVISAAIVHAIEADLPEVVLTANTQRPALVLQAILPRLLEWVVGRSGVNALFRAAADARIALRANTGDTSGSAAGGKP
jgi:hypothetical protein